MFKELVYITPDDYFNKFGEDLRRVVRNGDNESNEAEIFIGNITDHLKQWIDANTFRIIPFECLSTFQYNQFQKAILNQCYYTLHEGVKTLGLSSGIDDEKGVVIPYEIIREMEICPAALDCLTNAGLFNLVMKNRPRTLRGYPEYGFYDNAERPRTCVPERKAGNVAGMPGLGYTEVEEDE